MLTNLRPVSEHRSTQYCVPFFALGGVPIPVHERFLQNDVYLRCSPVSDVPEAAQSPTDEKALYANDRIKIIVFDLASHLALAFLANYRGILGSCQLTQFAICEDVFQVQTDVIGRSIKHVGQLALS